MADAFTYKLTTDSELFGFDFSQVLSTGETLSTATCSVIVMNGTDPSPSAILAGSAVITGSKANQRVSGGVSEVTYRLLMTVTTSLGNTFTAVGDLPIYDGSLV
jgi:hypothetical protein